MHAVPGATMLLDCMTIGPSGHGPPVVASKFWICQTPWSEFTQRQLGRRGSGLTV